MDVAIKAGCLTISLAAGDTIPASVAEVVAEYFACGITDASQIDRCLSDARRRHGEIAMLDISCPVCCN